MTVVTVRCKRSRKRTCSRSRRGETITEQFRETATALDNARAGGDEYAVVVLSTRLACLVREYRDDLVTRLEAACDELREAEARDGRTEHDQYSPDIKQQLRLLEDLCAQVRAVEYVPNGPVVAH